MPSVIAALCLVLINGNLMAQNKVLVETQPTTLPAVTTMPAESQPVTTPAKNALKAETQPKTPATKPAPPWYDSKGRDGILSGADTSATLWKMVAYIIVILVVGGVAIVLMKKFTPGLGKLSGRGREISLVETVYLSPRKTLHLVQVGKRRFLLAGSRESTTMLAEVTEAFDEILKSKSGEKQAESEKDGVEGTE